MESNGATGKWLWEEFGEGIYGLDDYAKVATKFGISRGKTPTDLMRHLIMCCMVQTADDRFYGDSEFQLQTDLDALKLKVNVKQLVDAANPEPPKPAKAAKSGKNGKETPKKIGKKKAARKALRLGGGG
jgi:hypothetical protein